MYHRFYTNLGWRVSCGIGWLIDPTSNRAKLNPHPPASKGLARVFIYQQMKGGDLVSWERGGFIRP